jgi:hypothetical protein
MLLVSRTRATLRKAEFGFLGVEVYTRTHTPRFCGQPCSAGLLVLYFGLLRPNLTNWLNVGKTQSPQSLGHLHQQANNPLSSSSDKAQNFNKPTAVCQPKSQSHPVSFRRNYDNNIRPAFLILRNVFIPCGRLTDDSPCRGICRQFQRL